MACPACGHDQAPTESPEMATPSMPPELDVSGAEDSESTAKSEILDELIALMQESVGKRLPKGAEQEEV